MNARVTLHHALIEHGRQSQVFRPNAHAHHEIEIGCILVSSAYLTNAIVGDTIGEAAVSHFPLKPLQVENSQTCADQWLIHQIIAPFEANRASGAAGHLQLCCRARNTHLLPRKDRSKRDGNIVDMLGGSVQDIQPNLTIGALHRWIGS